MQSWDRDPALQYGKTFINQQADKVKGNKIVTSSNFLKVKNQVCSCKECKHLSLDDQESSLKDPIAMVKSLLPYLKNLEGQLLQNYIRHFYRVECKVLKINVAKQIIV